MINQNKAHILVADDYEVNRKITQLQLQKAGYVVDLVENGQQAVEACRQTRYDLILMDIQMPIMDGLKATEEIRKWESTATQAVAEEGERLNKNRNNSDSNSAFRIPNSDFNRVPIIAMTGSAGEGSFVENQYPGMNDCIGKPLQRNSLLSLVQKWISPKSRIRTIEIPADETPVTGERSEINQFPLDLDRAILEFMGKKEILLGVLQNFINSAGSRIDNIRQAVKATDYHVIGLEAHAIKGAAANLTAEKLANLAADLEKAGEERQPDLTAELADKLLQEFCNLEKYVRQIPELITMNP
jgi:CheY-like chemotaxis protein/HPt (histidine-containing phosphotransfer) domain-containing protein